MNKIDGKTMNLTDENLKKLRELFPTVFNEDKIDFEKLKVLLGENIDKDNEKYAFTWKGKLDAIKLAQLQSTGTLLPCKGKSKNWDTTENLYIEGDNLEVLKLLQKSYVNKIKMIYIDPPYNTGKDLVYKDSFSDSIENYKQQTSQAFKSNANTDGRYHTYWLNMMYPRLKLAKNLLSKEGIIFISIDDNEARNLKIICDEIFGENNFIAQLIIEGTPKNDPLIISTAHEYCLVYVKNYDTAKELNWGIKNPTYSEILEIYNRNKENYTETEKELKEFYTKKMLNLDNISNYKFADERGVFRIGPIDDPQRNGARDIRYNPHTGEALVTPRSGWRCSLETWNKWLNDGLIFFPKDKTKLVSKKTYITEDRLDLLRAYFKIQTRKDTDMLESYFGAKVFQFPKPLELIKTFIESSTRDGDIILDFFSGSGTTGHAVMELNAEENTNRKFILVQLPENMEENLKTSQGNREKQTLINAINYCRENELTAEITSIAQERLKIAGEKINGNYPLITSSLDIGFKVFKLDISNIKKWDNSPTESVDDIKNRIQQSLFYLTDGRNDMDAVYEIMLKFGLPLTLPVNKKNYGNTETYTIENNDYKVLICLSENIKISEVEEMANESIGTYIFADRCFSDANDLINTEELLKKKDKQMRLF